MKKENDNALISSAKNIKLQKVLSSIVMVFAAIITLTIGVFAVFKTAIFNIVINFAGEEVILKSDNIFLNILYTILAFSILYFIYKLILPKINKKVLLAIALTFSLIISFWWINYVKIRPISDQGMVVYCAEKILNHDLKAILSPGEYLNRNPHQLRFCSLFNVCI